MRLAAGLIVLALATLAAPSAYARPDPPVSGDPVVSGIGVADDVTACARGPRCLASVLARRTTATAEEALLFADAREALGDQAGSERLRRVALAALADFGEEVRAHGDAAAVCALLRVYASASAHLPARERETLSSSVRRCESLAH